MNKKGLSLLEIIVATILLIFIVTGLMGIFISTKRRILMSEGRIGGAELGKIFVDPLQGHVRMTDWDTNTNGLCWCAAGPCACTGTYDAVAGTVTSYCDTAHPGQQNPVCPPAADRTIGGRVEYFATYVVSSPFPNIRRVRVDITWLARE